MPFQLGAVDGRAVLVIDGHVHDVATLSGHTIGPDPIDAIAAHRELGALTDLGRAGDQPASRIGTIDDVTLGPPVPRPGSCFAIGLNYQTHADEAGLDTPTVPVVFTKFPSCIAGPQSEVRLGTDYADFEVEVVAVIGTEASQVPQSDAWHHVAGLTVGNDLSDRQLQFAAKPTHFSLGKSRNGYGPTGPVIVSVDSFDDPGDLELSCHVNGHEQQRDRTSNLIFDIPFLIEYLSQIVTLRPGDLVFTGTPAGVGGPRNVFLRPGDEVVCSVEGIGSIQTSCH